MDVLERIEGESDAAYKLRLQCSLNSEKPFSFDEGVEFLRDFGFVNDSTTMADAEKMVEQLNAGKSWDQYNRLVLALES